MRIIFPPPPAPHPFSGCGGKRKRRSYEMHSTVLGTRTSSLSGSSCDQHCLVLQFFGFLHFEDQKKPRNIGALFPSGADIVSRWTIRFLFVVSYSVYSAKVLSSIKFHQTFQGFFRDFVLFSPPILDCFIGQPSRHGVGQQAPRNYSTLIAASRNYFILVPRDLWIPRAREPAFLLFVEQLLPQW